MNKNNLMGENFQDLNIIRDEEGNVVYEDASSN